MDLFRFGLLAFRSMDPEAQAAFSQAQGFSGLSLGHYGQQANAPSSPASQTTTAYSSVGTEVCRRLSKLCKLRSHQLTRLFTGDIDRHRGHRLRRRR